MLSNEPTGGTFSFLNLSRALINTASNSAPQSGQLTAHSSASQPVRISGMLRAKSSRSNGVVRPQQTATSTASATSTTSDSEASSRQLQISDRRLLKLANLAAASIDWDVLQFASATWKKKKKTAIMGGGEFNIMTRQDGVVHHILATGNIACSATEMRNILWTTTSERHVAAMAELHGASFFSGAALYHTKLDGDLASPPTTSQANCGLRDPTLSGHSLSGNIDVCVKTATFAKAHVFARDEQWCYLDAFQQQDQDQEHQKFTLTMQSLRSEDVLSPSSNPLELQRNQLQEMTAGYSVTTTDSRENSRSVRVSFYARYIDNNNDNSSNTSNSSSRASMDYYIKNMQSKKLDASKSTTKARLMKMAQATCYLPLIVQRRRLGAQVFANPKDFATPLPNNKHCKCCTVALTLLVQKKRCHLCSFRVCFKCSSKQQVERAYKPNNFETVRVCSKCMQRVNAANYDDLPSGVAAPSSIKRDAPNAAPASKLLAGWLQDSFEHAADEEIKRAVIEVVKGLLGEPPSSATSDSPFPLFGSSKPTQTSSDQQHHKQHDKKSSQNAILLTDEDFMDALNTKLQVKEFSLDECVLGNAQCRKYPISYKDEQDTSVPNFPVPANEELRLNFVRQRRLSDIKNVPELEIICSIARKELGCSAGLVTIVDQGEVHVIASSDAMFQNLVVPREESICSHTIMSDKPLLLPHADADIRFNRLGAVQAGVVSYYCGFPLITSDNAVIGSVCCIDSEDHDVTQAQYAMMVKLASTASRVMEMRAKADAA